MDISMKINEIFPDITLASIRDFKFSILHFMQILDHDHIPLASWLPLNSFCITFGFSLASHCRKAKV